MKKLATVVTVCLIAAAAVAFVPMISEGKSIEVRLPDAKPVVGLPFEDHTVTKFEDDGNTCYVIYAPGMSEGGNAISCVPSTK